MNERPRNLYADLGADVEADHRTIRGAYLAKARAHHPDLGGNARTMARINEAFEVLGDTKRRAVYDAEHAMRSRRRAANAPPWTGANGPPPGRPTGVVLDFGIYAGWSLAQIARRDSGYLVWLTDRKEGRPHLEEIERHLAPLRQPSSPAPRRGHR
jgi:curved DNA-binding protein CbpA